MIFQSDFFFLSQGLSMFLPLSLYNQWVTRLEKKGYNVVGLKRNSLDTYATTQSIFFFLAFIPDVYDKISKWRKDEGENMKGGESQEVEGMWRENENKGGIWKEEVVNWGGIVGWEKTLGGVWRWGGWGWGGSEDELKVKNKRKWRRKENEGKEWCT